MSATRPSELIRRCARPVADWRRQRYFGQIISCVPGPWGDYEGVSPVLEAFFAYDLGGKKISLSVGLDSTGQADEKKGGVIFRGNIHRDIQSEKDSASMLPLEIVAKWRDDLGAFCKMASSFWEKMQ